MKISKRLIIITILLAVFAAVYSSVGLFWMEGEGPFSFTTLHGNTVDMYGQGIYRFDTQFRAPVFRGTDAITLFVCVPALLAALWWAGRGSLKGRIMLLSVLTYFLYNSTSLAFGAAFNPLFPVYMAAFSLSFFAVITAFRSIDLQKLSAQLSAGFPRRGVAIFLFIAGASLLVWLIDLVAALSQSTVPANLGPYTTEITYVIDLGIILPTAWLAGSLVLRRSPLGVLLASMLIVLNITIGLVVVSQSVMQALEGIILTPGEYAAYVAPFASLSLVAIYFTTRIFRTITEPK